jgi:hypothetical protein
MSLKNHNPFEIMITSSFVIDFSDIIAVRYNEESRTLSLLLANHITSYEVYPTEANQILTGFAKYKKFIEP